MPHSSQEPTAEQLKRLHMLAQVRSTNDKRRRAALQDESRRGEAGQPVEPRVNYRRLRPIRLNE